MQTLGLSPTPKSESRLKTLFWPTIQSDVDVDLLTRQGFWVCFWVAVLSVGLSLVQGSYAGIFDAALFFLGGVGSRQRSRVAASVVLAIYVLSTLLVIRMAFGGGTIARAIVLGLLLGNARATWLVAKWPAPSAPGPSPIETFTDKFANRMPAFLWPKVRLLFYILAVISGLGFIGIVFPPRS